MSSHQWNTFATMLWFGLFFIVLGYEVYAGINPKHDIPMLTQVVVRYIPAPATLIFIGWLFVHFARRYYNPVYREWLRHGGAGG